MKLLITFDNSVTTFLFCLYRHVSESYAQKLAKSLVVAFKKALKSQGKSIDIDVIDLGNSIYNNVRYRLRDERKRKSLLLTGQQPEHGERISLSTGFHSFSKRACYGLDPERDVPPKFPDGESRQSLILKQKELLAMHDSGDSLNWSKVRKLMKETYVLQRMTINMNPNMENLLKEWPFFAKKVNNMNCL